MTGQPKQTRAGKTPKARRVQFSKGLAKTICQRISKGDTWSEICEADGMPEYEALFRWEEAHPAFAKELAKARERAADAWAEAALIAAKTATSATLPVVKLKVSTWLWHATRAAPQRYGARPEGAKGAAKDGADGQVRIREFVPVSREDGGRFTREIRLDGSFVDFDE